MSCEECEEEFKRLYDQLEYEYRYHAEVYEDRIEVVQQRRLVGPWQRAPGAPFRRGDADT